jgi:L-threonylcarbamoyladenylate synthase
LIALRIIDLMNIINWDQDNQSNEEKITEIVSVLSNGGLVILPTETVYGIAADATNPKALSKLNQYKARPPGKPYSIAVSSLQMAKEYVDINARAEHLYEHFLPGPVTVVSYGKHKLAPGVESEKGTLGVRIPDYPLVIEIVNALGRPITATSANASYKKRPYKISDILQNISGSQKKLLDLIVDVGTLPTREPSTVIDTTYDEPVVLRQGEVKLGPENTIMTSDSEGTQSLGKEMWQKFQATVDERPVIFALSGPMGVGKTQFTKGIARAMGIEEEVLSPTFSIEEKYRTGNHQLIHIDTWRLQDPLEEIEALKVFEHILPKSIFVIEWAERIADLIRRYDEEAVVVWIRMEYGNEETERKINWSTL